MRVATRYVRPLIGFFILPAALLLKACSNPPSSSDSFTSTAGSTLPAASPKPPPLGNNPGAQAIPSPSLHTSSLSPQVEVIRKNSPYLVTGNSPQEIFNSLDTHPTARSIGSFGRTNWSVTQVEGRVIVKIHKIIPALDPNAYQDPEFIRYLKALDAHEEGHAKNAMRVGNHVQSLMRSGKTFENAVLTAVEKGDQWDVTYDQETNHGETEGARYYPNLQQNPRLHENDNPNPVSNATFPDATPIQGGVPQGGSLVIQAGQRCATEVGHAVKKAEPTGDGRIKCVW
jgi:hypothetical protein